MIQDFLDSIVSLDMLRDDDETNAEEHAHVLEAIRTHLDLAVVDYLMDGWAWRGKIFRFPNVAEDVIVERLGM